MNIQVVSIRIDMFQSYRIDCVLDVRAAAIDSCYDISCCHDVFQSKLVEYIVSMFDDDIEHVRLEAMRILGRIAQGRVLRGEQVLSILTELLVGKNTSTTMKKGKLFS
jgi:hypothetical protein